MKPHEEWLYQAEHDLESSEFLLTSAKPLLDIAIYHTQQCAEKSLKAYLSYKEQELEKTHNLKMLIENCSVIDPAFQSLFDDCIDLNPFATLYRYPEGDLMPSKETVIKAISTSKRILNFVKDKTNS